MNHALFFMPALIGFVRPQDDANGGTTSIAVKNILQRWPGDYELLDTVHQRPVKIVFYLEVTQGEESNTTPTTTVVTSSMSKAKNIKNDSASEQNSAVNETGPVDGESGANETHSDSGTKSTQSPVDLQNSKQNKTGYEDGQDSTTISTGSVNVENGPPDGAEPKDEEKSGQSITVLGGRENNTSEETESKGRENSTRNGNGSDKGKSMARNESVSENGKGGSVNENDFNSTTGIPSGQSSSWSPWWPSLLGGFLFYWFYGGNNNGNNGHHYRTQ